MRVLVCGSRDYYDRQTLFNELDALHLRSHIDVVISGGAKGADTLADEWALENDITRLVFHANWKEHGKAAGAIRNKKMLVEGKPDLVLAFPSKPIEVSKGTLNMVTQARRANVIVRIIPFNITNFPDYKP